MVRSGLAIAFVGLLSLLSFAGIPLGAIAAPLSAPYLSSPAPLSTTTSPLAAIATTPLFTISGLTSGGTTLAALFSFPGTRPDNLGVKDGKLATCPGSPNCVSSQAPASDSEHYIAPLAYSGDASTALATLKSIIQSTERTAIISESDNYLYAEFTSALMGFVDDVEFYLEPAAGVIHVRSASRLGQSDLGVNRKRVEAIRSQFESKE
jgi:uncharacterized protein (DUF1499 family)